jgi:hypothetical protein
MYSAFANAEQPVCFLHNLKDNFTLNVRNYIVTFLIVTTFSLKSLGTAQAPDKLIYNGDTLSIFSNPLEQLPDIEKLRVKLFGDKEGCSSTACWRGYEATWEIVGNELYLIGIYSCCLRKDKIQADLKRLFGEKYINGKVKADWVTADILSPQGKLIHYIHMGYGSLYEREVVFEIENGQLQGTIIYDNSKSRQSEFSKDNNKLNKYLYRNIRWDQLPRQDKPVRVFVQFSANEKGIIDSVEVKKGVNDVFDKEAVRVVKSIPDWDVFYRMGKFERSPWILVIVFSNENKKRYKKK